MLNKFFCFLAVAIFLTACSVSKDVAKVESMREENPVVVKEEKSFSEKIKELKTKKDYKSICELYEKSKDAEIDITAFSYIMEAYFIETKFENVIEIGERIFGKFPGLVDGNLNLMLGIAYYNKGLYEVARRNLIKAKEEGVHNVLLATYLVDMYLKKGQNSLALTEAALLEGELKDYLQGVIFYNEGNYSRALEKFEKLKNYENSVLYKGYTLYKMNKTKELLDLWDSGVFDKNVNIYPFIVNVYLQRGEVLKAKQLLEKAVEENSNRFFVSTLGMIYELYLNDKEGAKKYYNATQN